MWYVEVLSEVRTKLAAFFNIVLHVEPCEKELA